MFITRPNRKMILTLAAFGALAGSLSACETVGGAGRDIENAGEAVQDAAD